MVEHGRAPEDVLGLLGKGGDGLAVQIVGDVPVVSVHDRGRIVRVAGDQRCQLDADGPAFGAGGDLLGQLGRQFDPLLAEDLPGSLGVQREVVGTDLEHIPAVPQARRRGAARCGWPR